MKKGIYAGTFDPFTNGHLHVVTQAAEIFDQVVIVISVNSKKKRQFPEGEMRLAILEAVKGMSNVTVDTWSGLVSDYATMFDGNYLVRGLRNGTDYEYEENIAKINEELAGVKTIYFRAGDLGHISSSFVKEVLSYGKDVSKWVPASIRLILGRT